MSRQSNTNIVPLKTGWKTVVEQNRSPTMISWVDQQEEKHKMVVKDEHAKYLERVERRRLKEAKRKEREIAEYISQMERKYGTRWYDSTDVQIIEGKKYRKDIAEGMLRDEWAKEEETYWKKLAEEEKMYDELHHQRLLEEAEEDRKRAELTPSEFNKWLYEKEMEDAELSIEYTMDGLRPDLMYAPSEYLEYYEKTSICLDWKQKPLENRQKRIQKQKHASIP